MQKKLVDTNILWIMIISWNNFLELDFLGQRMCTLIPIDSYHRKACYQFISHQQYMTVSTFLIFVNIEHECFLLSS